MNKLTNATGITRGALVITIIVLLILAAVSWSWVIGGDGIFTKAQTATEKTNTNVIKEQVEYSVAELMGEFFGSKYGDIETDPEPTEGQSVGAYIAENLKAKIGDITLTITGNPTENPTSWTIVAKKSDIQETATLSDKGTLSWTPESGS